MKGDWSKGYGRKGAALHAMGRLADATAAYEEGLKVEPGSAPLQSGLEEVRKARSAPPPRPPPAFSFPGTSPTSAISLVPLLVLALFLDLLSLLALLVAEMVIVVWATQCVPWDWTLRV